VVQVVNCRLPQEVRFTIVYIYKCSINKVFIIIIIVLIVLLIIIIIVDIILILFLLFFFIFHFISFHFLSYPVLLRYTMMLWHMGPRQSLSKVVGTHVASFRL
jgi:uncharacterized membrane protein